MANKILTGILVLLVILMGGIGYYSYTLGQQIEDLSERLAAFEMEQTARIDTLSNELAEFRGETLGSINNLEDKITENLAEIDALDREIGVTQGQIASLEGKIDEVASQADNLEERLTEAVAELSGSMIDASEVYQKVSQATVRVSDGQNTIGSGIIYDTQAHVITAHHVVSDLSQIYVILHDGRISQATSLGYCQYSDIVVLELEDNPDIEPPPLADSSQVRIGEPVVTIGSPLDLRDTLTAGTISQINRAAEIDYDTQSRWVTSLLQFDAAVNAGNSGCPLANADGEIIGIVVARVYPSEGNGISYAVTANKAKRVATSLIDQGYFDYPWLGVDIADLTPQMVQDMALETANGVWVGHVNGDSPAEAAGIEADDIIVSMDDIPVKDKADFASYLGELKSPGDLAKIKLIRDTTELELSIEIGKRP